MNLESVPVGTNPPHDVNVIIEVPIGGEPIKYELDRASGILVVDRFLYTSMRYPGNYGFSPHTLSSDGDPCDVLVVNTRAITPGAMISIQQVKHFFEHYKDLENEKWVKVTHWGSVEKPHRLILKGCARAAKQVAAVPLSC